MYQVLESLIRGTIVDHMNINKLYTEYQHDFRKHRSGNTQLLEVMEGFTLMLDIRKIIDVVFLDYKKAFDSVPLERLLKIWEHMGLLEVI